MLLYYFKAAAAKAAAAIITIFIIFSITFAVEANAIELNQDSTCDLPFYSENLLLRSEPAISEDAAVMFTANLYISSFSKSTYNKYIEIENVYFADDRESGGYGRHNVGDRIPMYTIALGDGTRYSAYCVEPGADVHGDWLYEGADQSVTSDLHWVKLVDEHPIVAENIRIVVGCAKQYSDDSEAKAAAQIIVWELLSGRRDEYSGAVLDTSLYDAITSQGTFTYYYNFFDNIIAEYRNIPGCLSYSEKHAETFVLKYDSDEKKYSVVIEDTELPYFEYIDWEGFTGLEVSELTEERVVLSSESYSPDTKLCAGNKDPSKYFNDSENSFLIFNSSDSGTRGQTLVCGIQPVQVPVYLKLVYEDVGFLQIEKSSEDNIIEGVEFTIQSENNNDDVWIVNTDSNGIANIVLNPGRYIVSEMVSEIYTPQTPKIVEIIPGTDTCIRFVNTLIVPEQSDEVELPDLPKDEEIPPIAVPETDDILGKNIYMLFMIMVCTVPLCKYSRCSGIGK